MRLVLTEITRLHGGNCCIAGYCREDCRFHRLSNPSVSRVYVEQNRWRIGTEIEGDFAFQAQGNVHVEDSTWQAAPTGMIAESWYLKWLFGATAVLSLSDALGIVGRGTPVENFRPQRRSIVTIRPSYISVKRNEPYREGGNPSVRAEFCCSGSWMKLVPITDIRFFHPDGTINDDAVIVAQRHINAVRAGEEEVFVRVGVTRPFDPEETGNLRYWVQIDGLHFFSTATGKYVRDFNDGGSAVVGNGGV